MADGKFHIDVLYFRMKLVNYETNLNPDMKQANIICELTINGNVSKNVTIEFEKLTNLLLHL